MLAGDHLQLPPIVAGTYPETPPGEPLLHRSIFEAVVPAQATARLARAACVRPLLENFRMNDVLTGFAGHLLYGPGYRCVNAAVSAAPLPFKGGRKVDPLVRACLDPDLSAGRGACSTASARRRANPVEADLVAQL